MTISITITLTDEQAAMLRRSTEVDLMNAKYGLERLAMRRGVKRKYLAKRKAWIATLETLLAQLPSAVLE